MIKLHSITKKLKKWSLAMLPSIGIQVLFFHCWHAIVKLLILASYEKEVYAGWTTGIEDKCKFNLAQPLIKRNATNQLISVNFDPQVKSLFHLIVFNITSTFF